VRGDIEKPRQYQCHWKSGDDHQHDDSLRQRRHFEDRKNLRDNLHEQPARHGIGGTNFIDMAPLQLGEKRLHFPANALSRDPFSYSRDAHKGKSHGQLCVALQIVYPLSA